MYTVAAGVGALAAHRSGDAWATPWTLSYAAMILLAGVILHRRMAARARAVT